MSNIKNEENNKHDYSITTYSLNINSCCDANNTLVKLMNNFENVKNICDSLKNSSLFTLPLSGIELDTKIKFEQSIESLILTLDTVLSPERINKEEFQSEIDKNYKKYIKELEKKIKTLKEENEKLIEKLNDYNNNKSNLNYINNSEKIEIKTLKIKEKENDEKTPKESLKKSDRNKKKPPKYTEEEKRMIKDKEEVNTINYMLTYTKGENEKKGKKN